MERLHQLRMYVYEFNPTLFGFNTSPDVFFVGCLKNQYYFDCKNLRRQWTFLFIKGEVLVAGTLHLLLAKYLKVISLVSSPVPATSSDFSHVHL